MVKDMRYALVPLFNPHTQCLAHAFPCVRAVFAISVGRGKAGTQIPVPDKVFSEIEVIALAVRIETMC